MWTTHSAKPAVQPHQFTISAQVALSKSSNTAPKFPEQRQAGPFFAHIGVFLTGLLSVHRP